MYIIGSWRTLCKYLGTSYISVHTIKNNVHIQFDTIHAQMDLHSSQIPLAIIRKCKFKNDKKDRMAERSEAPDAVQCEDVRGEFETRWGKVPKVVKLLREGLNFFSIFNNNITSFLIELLINKPYFYKKYIFFMN